MLTCAVNNNLCIQFISEWWQIFVYFPIVLVIIIEPQLSYFTVKDLLNSVDDIKAKRAN